MLVVSGDPLARAGLGLLLGGQEGITVSGQVAPDEDWPGPGDPEAPHAALWDLGLGLRSGVEELRALSAGLPVVAVVADVADAREALAAGARGALSRGTPTATSWPPPCAPPPSGSSCSKRPTPAPSRGLRRSRPPSPSSLTPRELEVLQRLTQGLSNKQIAQRLGVSDHTGQVPRQRHPRQARRPEPQRGDRPGRAARPGRALTSPIAQSPPGRSGDAARFRRGLPCSL